MKKKLQIIKRNYNLLGLRYVLWDIVYQLARTIHNKTKKRDEEDKTLTTKKIHHYKMLLHKKGKGIHRDLTYNGTREQVAVDIIKKLIKRGDTTLEAGANIGYYALLESTLVGKKGTVYAVEPIKENYKLLQQNVKLNKKTNIKSYNKAFSNKEQQLTINLSSDGNLHTPRKITNTKKKTIIQATTIDKFLQNKKKPTFMRMDIEGYEDKILEGAKKTLTTLKTLFIELHFPYLQPTQTKKILRQLQEQGFEIHKAILEWERTEQENNKLAKTVNYLYKKRSKPKIYHDMTIKKLLQNKNYTEGHHCLELILRKIK